MNRAHPVRLLMAIFALIAVLGGLSLARGGLYMDRYEGDVLHLIEIVVRIAEGQRPHLDFMTPIGVLATWPIAVFVKAGFGIGVSIHLAQISVAVVLALPVFWAGWTRFSPGFAYIYALFCMVLALALVHGEADPNVSMSMHYNRWAWAFSFVALALAFLPARGRETALIDGALIGVALAIVVLVKVTYIVALAPGIIVALLVRGAGRTLAVALVSGVVTLALVTLIMGWQFWPAYVGDLIATATSEARAHPGRPLNKVLTAPMFLGAHMLVLLCVVMLRQGGRPQQGLALLVLFPGLVYITYQNFGNDPQWLLLIGLMMLMVRPAPGEQNAWGWDLRQGVTLAAVAMLALISPSFFNMGYSPFRHFTDDRAEYVKIFPNSTQHDDFYTSGERAFQVNQQIAGERPGAGLEQFAALSERGELAVLNGETLPACGIQNGLIAYYTATVEQLEAHGFADGSSIMMADLLSNLPLFSDGISWVKGGAPWRYDGVPGVENADYVLVPLCAVNERSRRAILQGIRDRDITLREVHRNPLFVLLEKA
ncbi:glycosyltransferase family 87 protein [Oceaniglobus ichthyenteri]|uniref:glycosyltransferase family 87 protein n=1 Tax=Oceaniglobus ichthyenteri TaxID=2136177 RepID=UPI000F849021|nr:glycosyltransferase family 87 protein [Oceaniglobus ichthyenteri]